MAPRRAGEETSTEATRQEEEAQRRTELAGLNCQQINSVMPTIATQIAENVTATLNMAMRQDGGGNANDRNAYKTFTSCNPKEFYGTEGPVGLLTWFQSMEAILNIIDYAPADRVKFAASKLQGRALAWWNLQVTMRGQAVMNALTWEQLKEEMKREYCPRPAVQKLEIKFWNHAVKGMELEAYVIRFHELCVLVPDMVNTEAKKVKRFIYGLVPEVRLMVTAANPITLEEAVSLSTRLVNDLVRTGKYSRGESSSRQGGGKRFGDRKGIGLDERQKIVRNYGVDEVNPNPNRGQPLKCNRCGYNHLGECRHCTTCNQLGYLAATCRNGARVGGNPRVCHECGGKNHWRNVCPRLGRAQVNRGNGNVGNRGNGENRANNGNQGNNANRNRGNQGGQARGRVYAMGANEAGMTLMSL
uniref:uncharacterized protein LOC122601318 n=1 Tax=Erigeron canadensis TaxID=72917 RepID=UPI001CB93FBE|nr:uncharacterized protein LOC122601318 [Erigeron canadensis]